jgi:hypothetical protein
MNIAVLKGNHIHSADGDISARVFQEPYRDARQNRRLGRTGIATNGNRYKRRACSIFLLASHESLPQRGRFGGNGGHRYTLNALRILTAIGR